MIIGTKAVNDFEWFSQMAEKYPAKIALGLDARGSKVATHAWTQDSPQDSPHLLLEFAIEAAKLPLAAIIYTDITKDGMMAGPNLERTKALVQAVQLPVIASGGISQIDDIKKLAEIGAEAAIIGRSLYEGTLNLSDAINAAKGLWLPSEVKLLKKLFSANPTARIAAKLGRKTDAVKKKASRMGLRKSKRYLKSISKS